MYIIVAVAVEDSSVELQQLEVGATLDLLVGEGELSQ